MIRDDYTGNIEKRPWKRENYITLTIDFKREEEKDRCFEWNNREKK